MAVYQTNFLYELDQDGNSTNGHVDTLVANSAANATEQTDDSIVSVGEQFTVVFTDPVTGATYDDTYTYIGHDPAFSGFIAERGAGDYYLFSNDGGIPIGTNLNGFTAEDFILCFLAGTMIECPGGERAVETLAIGDPVLTTDGRAVPVKWLARQTIAPFFGIPDERRPVVIAAGALGDNLPVRDLRVTSDHALLLDGVLVQAGALVNGSTIRRVPKAELGERFTVYHIETESHEVILAEGCPAETFIDNVSRRRFDNYAEYEAMFGAEDGAMEELPQPRAMSARQVPSSIRARIARRSAAMASGPARAA